MSQQKFEKIVEKYKKTFALTTQDFMNFVKRKVELSMQKCNQLQKWLNQLISNGQFDQDMLIQLLHLLSAFQAEEDISTSKINQKDLKKFTNIKFKRGSKKKQKNQADKDNDGNHQLNNKCKENQGKERKEKQSNSNQIKQISENKEIQDSTTEKQTQNQINKKQQKSKQQINETYPNKKKTSTKMNGQKTKQPPSTEQQNEKNPKQNKKNQEILNENQPFNSTTGKQLIDIPHYEKKGQDFINPVIKYQIIYNTKYTTWRRYSQIQKLIIYLKYQYQGITLPDMPPKEGIKGNITHLWKSGVNEEFLEERREKLKLVLNRVLACDQVCKNQVLQQFLMNDSFEVPSLSKNAESSYLQTLVGIKDIVLNYNELKGYGLAYYNYLMQSKKTINTQCTKEFDTVQQAIESIKIINEHRMFINENFQKRREIMTTIENNNKNQEGNNTNFDKLLSDAQIQCEELKQQYGRYLQLKYTEGWQKQLMRQKQTEGGKNLQKLQEDHKKTEEKVSNVEKNLLISIRKFKQKTMKLLQGLGMELVNWRSKVHP